MMRCHGAGQGCASLCARRTEQQPAQSQWRRGWRAARTYVVEESVVARCVHDDDPRVVLRRLDEHRQLRLPQRAIVPAQHGVEEPRGDGLGDLDPVVAGDPDEANLTLVTRRDHRFVRTARAHRLRRGTTQPLVS